MLYYPCLFLLGDKYPTVPFKSKWTIHSSLNSRLNLRFLPESRIENQEQRFNGTRYAELFCCLVRDCNYRDEKLRSVNFKSALYCTSQNIVFKALGRFGSFLNLYMYIQIETFMCTITSHKIKQRAKYQTEMLSRIAKTAILVKSSNYKLSFQRKTNPQTVDTDNQTFNCDNADGHSQTGNRKNISK